MAEKLFKFGCCIAFYSLDGELVAVTNSTDEACRLIFEVDVVDDKTKHRVISRISQAITKKGCVVINGTKYKVHKIRER